MPELPEVETVLRGLVPAVMGKKIDNICVNRFDLRFPVPEDFSSRLSGCEVTGAQRRGKYILVFTNNGQGFVMHLGMSGKVNIYPPGQPYEPAKHDHIIFDMDDTTRVVFNDPRRFGMMGLISADNWQQQKPFADMGPESLGNEFNGPALKKRLEARRSSIKAALLDQRVVAGIGNIYACEALYISGISPDRQAGSINGKEAEKLSAAIRDVLERAIMAGGSTLRDYQHTDGSLGYFQHSFSVYDREGEACPQCNCDIFSTHGVKRIRQAGRSTFYCPEMQK